MWVYFSASVSMALFFRYVYIRMRKKDQDVPLITVPVYHRPRVHMQVRPTHAFKNKRLYKI